MVLIGEIIRQREEKAKAMISKGVKPFTIASKTGLSQMWIELQYLGGRRNG